MNLSLAQPKVRIASSSWNPGTFTNNGVYYSTRLPLEEADALFSLYDPMLDMLNFKGPKLWFTLEPQWHSFWKKGISKCLVSNLKDGEIAYYAHPNPKYRIPHTAYLRVMRYSNNN